MHTVSSIQEMREWWPESARSTVNVLGYREPGDGGGGIFYWDDRSNIPENGGTVICSGRQPIGRWLRLSDGSSIQAKWFGAIGDGKHDDAGAIQQALNAAQSGARFTIPPGEYAVSRPLHISTMDLIVDCQGTIVPFGDYSGELIHFVRAPREQFTVGSDIYQLRVKVEQMKIRGKNQSKGIYIAHVDQSMFSNIDIEGTSGTAIRIFATRHTTFLKIKISRCRGNGEAILDLFERTGSPCPHGGHWQAAEGVFDTSNCLIFINLSIEICEADTYVDIGVEDPHSLYASQNAVRDIYFYGSIFHGLIRDYVEPEFKDTHRMNLGFRKVPWNIYNYSLPRQIRLIRLRGSRAIKFSQCHFTFGSTTGTLLELGEADRKAAETLLIGCGFGMGARFADDALPENNRIMNVVNAEKVELTAIVLPDRETASLFSGDIEDIKL